MALTFTAVLLCAESAHAYQWMMRHGYAACSVCHADPSGGELLTPYGRLAGESFLRMSYGEQGEGKYGFAWGAVETPDWLMLGGSYRSLAIYKAGESDPFTYVPVMQGDLYGHVQAGRFRAGGSIGISKVRPGSPHGRAAQVTAGQGDELNLISRTHWLGLDVADDFLLRVGRLNLPYGLRIPEHVMWVREATLTDRESDQQHGAALAYTGEEFRGEFMLIAGNYQINPDDFRERGYSAFLEGLLSEKVALGMSSKVTHAFVDKLTFANTTRHAHGIYGRAALLEQLYFMAELDALATTDASLGYVGLAQFDFEVVRGLHLLLTGEVLDEGFVDQPEALDPPERSAGAGQPRFGGWASVDWFFYKQLEFRVDVQARQEAPLTLLGQLHFFL